MRIENGDRLPLSHAYLWLTDTEASELRDALNDLLGKPPPDWHVHVASSDFAVELTVARDDGISAATPARGTLEG